MNGAELKKKLIAGGPCLGCWMCLSDPAVAESLADVGFDFVIIDAQHAPMDLRVLQSLLIAFKGSETVPMVRPGWNDFALINWSLDLGAGGILVPIVDTAEQARSAVQAARYPPLGRRSVGLGRSTAYGRHFEECLATANDNTILMTQVESKEALDNLDELVRVDGIDCLLVGPQDLGASLMGIATRDTQETKAAIDGVLQKCLQAGKPMGIAPSGGPEVARKWFDRGASLVVIGLDLSFMQLAASEFLEEFRRLG